MCMMLAVILPASCADREKNKDTNEGDSMESRITDEPEIAQTGYTQTIPAGYLEASVSLAQSPVLIMSRKIM